MKQDKELLDLMIAKTKAMDALLAGEYLESIKGKSKEELLDECMEQYEKGMMYYQLFLEEKLK